MMWLTWLADAARKTGFPVVEQPGWQTRGAKTRANPTGQMHGCEGIVGHHTATPASAEGDYPSLRVVRDGRTGLPGPLSHLGIGRSGTIYVIAAGRCNHAGVSSHNGFTDLNGEYIGIEAEHPGTDRTAWPTKQLDAYTKLVAALLIGMHRDVNCYASHRLVALPAGRKVDPVGIADGWMRDRAKFHMNAWAIGPNRPTDAQAAEQPWLHLPTMRLGDRDSAAVRALQAWGNRKYSSYWHLVVDGDYGDATRRAVAQFQARMHLVGADFDGTLIGNRTKLALWDEGFRG